jgi:hypothetical protein
VQLRHFYKKQIIVRHLFPDPNNGAAFVPEAETSLAGSGEWPGFLLVSLQMAEKIFLGINPFSKGKYDENCTTVYKHCLWSVNPLSRGRGLCQFFSWPNL